VPVRLSPEDCATSVVLGQGVNDLVEEPADGLSAQLLDVQPLEDRVVEERGGETRGDGVRLGPIGLARGQLPDV
jgi:hypothetical protein